IDLGSGSVKVALVSNGGEVVASAARSISTQQLPGGGAEQDPEAWWAAAVDGAREVLGRAALPPDRIAAIKCATQWSVITPVDREGNVLHPAISWMDTRGGPHNRRLMDGPITLAGYDPWRLWRWVRATGACPTQSGVDSLGHILFLKHERPEVYARTHKLLEPMDYLNLRLTGRFAASHGTIFPYFLTDNRDPTRVDYDPELLRLSGVDREKLPDLVPVDAVVGTLTPAAAELLGLSPSTRVMAGACDGHTAGVGAGAVRDFDGYFYIGTTSWLSCHVPWKKSDLLRMLVTMPSAIPGRYMVVAEQGMAGRCLEFLKDNILFPEGPDGMKPPPDVYDLLSREAARAPAGSDGLIFTPWINGVLVPEEDPTTRSAFFNQSWRTTRAHYVRAVMEGVAYNLRWLRSAVEGFVGRPFAQLNFIGGAALSDVWCNILADVLRCPVRQVRDPRNANAVGAALAAFAALGEIRVDDIPGLVKFAAVYEPDPANARVYDEQFEEFRDFYRRMKQIYRR
ncbi:MAG: FGGY-family carbohydrate kinase, partial [Deltaproteobacteria bacterium]|nr:FGGY-family carbohydrate kinase [Deltaproteobacteria bacterium]